jgi:PKD repeat protein
MSGQPSFTADYFNIFTGGSVDFTDTSTNNPLAWRWNFGDGTSYSTEQSPSHQYLTPGAYTVTLETGTPGVCMTVTTDKSQMVYQNYGPDGDPSPNGLGGDISSDFIVNGTMLLTPDSVGFGGQSCVIGNVFSAADWCVEVNVNDLGAVGSVFSIGYFRQDDAINFNPASPYGGVGNPSSPYFASDGSWRDLDDNEHDPGSLSSWQNGVILGLSYTAATQTLQYFFNGSLQATTSGGYATGTPATFVLGSTGFGGLQYTSYTLKHCCETVNVNKPTSLGEDPRVVLYISRDGGQTFGLPHYASLGRTGKYKNRVRFNQLGSARDAVFKVVISEPVRVVMLSGYLDWTGGTS